MHNKLKSRLGFTMAELLIVVAIMGVLGGVGFIAVQNHQRSLAQLERDTVAKELFVAAQNHLALAKSEGYVDALPSSYGTQGDAEADESNSDIYYFYSNSGSGFVDGSLLNLMLPFGAIEESVRTGNYIIRYQPRAAVVLDVFYWTTNDSNDRFNCNDLDNTDYATLTDGYREPADKHKKYPGGLLGWFGGEEKVETGVSLSAPDINVINGEKLLVEIRDNNKEGTTGASLKLIISGQSSGAMAALDLSSGGDRVSGPDSDKKYVVTLDDITSEKALRFAKINGDDPTFDFLKVSETAIPFIPGENITVQAVSYSNTALTSVAYSGEVTTNSLFAEISQRNLDQLYAELTDDVVNAGSPVETDAWITAKIGSIRHLENLDARISHLNKNDKLAIAYAMQTADLDWSAFLNEMGGGATIYNFDGTAAKADCYVSVKPSANSGSDVVSIPLVFNGNGVVSTTVDDVTSYSYVPHSIKGIQVDVDTGNGGLFDTLSGGGVSNLELIDFKINVISGYAGALVGEAMSVQVSNVLARESTAPTTTTADIIALSGSAGGLIGALSNPDNRVERCAAALTVSGGVYAGGLVGLINGSASVKDSYSGGHTEDRTLEDGSLEVRYSDTAYNVTASGTAGGLIGSAGTAAVENCYSTCSAIGATAGGLVGSASGTISNSYCTGLVAVLKDAEGNPVSGATEGAFAGSLMGTATGCWYYEIINERVSDAKGYDYLGALGLGSSDGIAALDESVSSYDAFVGGPATWNGATPYDDTLKNYYQDKFNLKTVDQLALGTAAKAATTDKSDFVASHYGDWPVPEIFVVNES